MTDTSPLISIIIPVYKVEPYLRQCLDSVLAQTYPHWEAICINDGSPDNCGAILDEYAAKDSRFIVIHQENQGVSAARNRGLEIMKGDYLTFIDPDDWVNADAFETVISIALKHKANYIVGSLSLINNETQKSSIKTPFPNMSDEIMFFKHPTVDFLRYTLLAACGTFISKKIITYPIKFNTNIKIGEDSLLWLKQLTNATNIVLTKKTLYNYRLSRPGSATEIGKEIPFREYAKYLLIYYLCFQLQPKYCSCKIWKTGIFLRIQDNTLGHIYSKNVKHYHKKLHIISFFKHFTKMLAHVNKLSCIIPIIKFYLKISLYFFKNFNKILFH